MNNQSAGRRELYCFIVFHRPPNAAKQRIYLEPLTRSRSHIITDRHKVAQSPFLGLSGGNSPQRVSGPERVPGVQPKSSGGTEKQPNLTGETKVNRLPS